MVHRLIAGQPTTYTTSGGILGIVCQRLARTRATPALAPPYSFLRHATLELGQQGARWGPRVGS
jgi:hypothetical protein